MAAVLLWIPAVGVGIRLLLQYSNTTGRLAAPPLDWPRSAGLLQEPGQSTLIVFAHPKCPCSRATIGELALIIARCRGKVKAYVLFYAPRSMGQTWAKDELWSDALAIPGVQVVEDEDGRKVRRFGASTSGQTLLYDSDGRVFNGGITAARGHFGANDGMDAVVSMLEHGKTKHHTAPVFGCSMLGLGEG